MAEIREYPPCEMKWIRHKNPRNTICNDLREIYYEAEKIGSEKIMLLARIGVSKGKAMDKKLREYKFNPKHLFKETNEK